jgi:hypothetical protein
MKTQEPFYPNQAIPLALTFVVLLGGTAILAGLISLLNALPFIHTEPISLAIRWPDVLIGLTIYLKTSIDFAIFIGRLMADYPGWKNRVMIEIGTAAGNIAGTLIILIIWSLFREVHLLMGLMIIVASLVLLRLAEDGLDHVKDEEGAYKVSFGGIEVWLDNALRAINKVTHPLLSRIVPSASVASNKRTTLWALFVLSFSVPFILGLDDFAGYLPLFNIVNVFGFAIGVFAGHTLLNIALFLSPQRTIYWVKHPLISFFGSIAFIGLAIWGLIEAIHLLS